MHCETKPAEQKSSNKIFGPDLIFFFPTEAKKRWILLIWSKWEGKKIETFFPTPAKKLPMFELPPFNQWRKECSRLFHEQQAEMLNCWKYKYDVSNRLETNDTILLNSNLRVCVKIGNITIRFHRKNLVGIIFTDFPLSLSLFLQKRARLGKKHRTETSVWFLKTMTEMKVK